MKKLDLTGQKFGKLLVLEEATNEKNKRIQWLCQCDCGNKSIVYRDHLRDGHTRSCGCLHKETVTKQLPHITTAKMVWMDNYKELPFEHFFEKSQQNCFYCGNIPSNKSNSFLIKSEGNSSQYAKDNGNFIYNGLDRIDSSLGHTIENTIPCCFICNRAKRERTFDEFINYINKIILNINKPSPELYRNLSKEIDLKPLLIKENYSFIAAVNDKLKDRYNDGNLTINEFYQLTQLNCYYCGTKPSNKCKNFTKFSSFFTKLTGWFIYSGLDRIDNSHGHDYDNVIPCCKYCNYAKGNLSLNEFYEWIFRLQKQKAETSSAF